MKCSLSYSLRTEEGQEQEGGEAETQLGEEGLSVQPDFGDSLQVKYRDVSEIGEEEYEIHLALNSGEELVLSRLGYRYEDFLRVLSKLRNEVLLEDLLMDETLRKSDVEADFRYSEAEGGKEGEGRCHVRLYETALVLMPDGGDFVRLPYGLLSGVEERDYELAVEMESGEALELSRMGREFEPFKNELSEALNDLSLTTQDELRELLPGIDATTVRRAARMMRDGRAARRSDLEAVSRDLWNRLESELEAVGIKREYDLLRSLSQEREIRIGFKRGLMGDLTGSYLWFLIPIYGTDPEEPGNAVAMEAGSEEDGGKATYFFRIVGREEYPDLSRDELDSEADRTLDTVNRAMLDINFRREPIYVSEEKLKEPRYSKYRFSINRLSALRKLRDLYVGRVIHRSGEQWRSDVTDLLEFNVEAEGNDARWRG
ncbi:MAG: hypothetical protein MAG715_01191 [Methanonatronarchaeales archaeon]|nr:hypothetical protein [Methanonatronarchaeales archaeon]